MRARISFFTTWNSLATRVMTLGLLFLCTGFLNAQEDGEDNPGRSNGQARNDQDRQESRENGVSAGGQWMEFRSEDQMTAAKHVRFELPANDSRDGADQARIILYCTDGKMNLADFRPNIRLGRRDWPGFWGQTRLRVRV